MDDKLIYKLLQQEPFFESLREATLTALDKRVAAQTEERQYDLERLQMKFKSLGD